MAAGVGPSWHPCSIPPVKGDQFGGFIGFSQGFSQVPVRSSNQRSTSRGGTPPPLEQLLQAVGGSRDVQCSRGTQVSAEIPQILPASGRNPVYRGSGGLGAGHHDGAVRHD